MFDCKTCLSSSALSVIIGCLYWIILLGKKQTKLNAEIWAMHAKSRL